LAARDGGATGGGGRRAQPGRDGVHAQPCGAQRGGVQATRGGGNARCGWRSWITSEWTRAASHTSARNGATASSTTPPSVDAATTITTEHTP
jgi:hypothetical protein